MEAQYQRRILQLQKMIVHGSKSYARKPANRKIVFGEGPNRERERDERREKAGERPCLVTRIPLRHYGTCVLTEGERAAEGGWAEGGRCVVLLMRYLGIVFGGERTRERERENLLIPLCDGAVESLGGRRAGSMRLCDLG